MGAYLRGERRGRCVFLGKTMSVSRFVVVFFFNDTATTEIYTLSLHDALPIFLSSIISSMQDTS